MNNIEYWHSNEDELKEFKIKPYFHGLKFNPEMINFYVCVIGFFDYSDSGLALVGQILKSEDNKKIIEYYESTKKYYAPFIVKAIKVVFDKEEVKDE
mgnify:CR=1 FL=1